MPVLLLLAGAPAGAEDTEALEAGNRWFEKDDLETALDTYAEGWTGDGSPLNAALAYNAGTAALRLGRLPEALLWFRRAQAAAPRDPWVRDNLTAARASLGHPPPEAPLPWRVLLRHAPWIAFGGIALAWAAFALVALRKPPRPVRLALLAVLSGAVFAAGFLAGRVGPRPAVLLEPCPDAKTGLRAGSEVWVRPDGDGWRIVEEDGDLVCPGKAVGLVEP
ncbi:MAG TPA: tetratricopeptide repeat protein [Thermoanaerobaculia bacterium]